MRNTFSKLFALLLCAGMLFALLPTFAAAENTEPDEPAIELPGDEDVESAEESAQEPAKEESVPGESGEGDTTLPELPIYDSNIVVLEEELVPGINSFPIEKTEIIYYRRVRPTEDGYYEFVVNNAIGQAHLADGGLNELSEYAGREIFQYLSAGETYYFGISIPDGRDPGTVQATLTVYSANVCGDNMTWTFDEDTGTLKIRGEREMWNYEPDTAPWVVYKDQIRTVDFSSVPVLSSIGSYAFYQYPNLTTLKLANGGLYSIGEYSFYGTGLTELDLPSRAKEIKPYAFAECKDLKTLTMRRSNGYGYFIRDHAFYGSGLENITFSDDTKEIEPYAFANCPYIEAIVLPDLLRVIPEGAFQNSGIRSIRIGNNVTDIGIGALAGCTRLTPDAFIVDAENETFTTKDGLLLTKDGRTVISALYQTASGAYTTPTGIQAVADGAFFGCSALTKLTVSPGVVSIGRRAFEDCSQMTDVSLPLTLTKIEDNAFKGCLALTDAWYPAEEQTRLEKLTINSEGNDALLNATWHYQEPCSFDGTVEWDESVQFKGTTPYLVWTGEPLTPGITLKTADGETVDPATYTVEYRENVNAGTAYIFVTFTEGYTGTMRLFFKIYLPATTETSISNVKEGVKLSWKEVPGADGYVIYRRAWNLQSSGWTTFERWNNTTSTTWTDQTVYAGTRYQYGVKAYFNRRMDPVTGAMIGGNVGDNFNLGVVGPLKTTVRITTRRLSMLKSGSGKITATWEPSKVFTGYDLRYATDETFTKNLKTIRITDPATSSTTLKSLKNGTYYYVSVRSYHLFEGMTYYGQWSNVIRIKPGNTTTMYDVMYRAVTVGENNYRDNPLKGCINDANSINGMLKGLKRPFTVKLLRNVSKTAMINEIRTAFADTWDNDISVFHYSGHGVNASGSPDYEQMQGALVSVDMQYITFEELAEELSKVRGRVIVILDSCHSGASIAKSDEENQKDLEAFNQAAIDAFSGYCLEAKGEEGDPNTRMGELKQSKFIVITAASAGQSSYDGKFDGSGYYQGAFCAAIIKGLGCTYPNGHYTGSMPADTNGDGKITLKELYDYAAWQARSWAPQDIQYYGPDSEVLFCR